VIIAARGILSHAEAGTDRAMLTFPSVTALASGSLIATLRAGATKDDAGERIEIHRAASRGDAWSGPVAVLPAPHIDGKAGSLKLCYLTETMPGSLLAAAMWVDRQSHPGAPLFNTETDGCLPMAIVLARSDDDGQSWGPWQRVPLPARLGPPSLTAPILALPDGGLVMSIETNKTYADAGPWDQRAVFLGSGDGGTTWSEPRTVARDPSGRLFNWDMRCAVRPDGRIETFAWTYDTSAGAYLDIHRRTATADASDVTEPVPLGFADQPGRPAILPDDRLVLPYVDRFGAGQICARVAHGPDGDFGAPIVLHRQEAQTDTASAGKETLSQMSQWSYGLPSAEVLPGGAVLILWYAGTPERMDIHWARLIDPEPAER
jgi:hypothetical protein